MIKVRDVKERLGSSDAHNPEEALAENIASFSENPHSIFDEAMTLAEIIQSYSEQKKEDHKAVNP